MAEIKPFSSIPEGQLFSLEGGTPGLEGYKNLFIKRGGDAVPFLGQGQASFIASGAPQTFGGNIRPISFGEGGSLIPVVSSGGINAYKDPVTGEIYNDPFGNVLMSSIVSKVPTDFSNAPTYEQELAQTKSPFEHLLGKDGSVSATQQGFQAGAGAGMSFLEGAKQLKQILGRDPIGSEVNAFIEGGAQQGATTQQSSAQAGQAQGPRFGESTYGGNSIVDYLSSVGQPSDFNSRAGLARELGIENYRGTAAQNLDMLRKLRQPTALADTVPASITGGAVPADSLSGADTGVSGFFPTGLDTTGYAAEALSGFALNNIDAGIFALRQQQQQLAQKEQQIAAQNEKFALQGIQDVLSTSNVDLVRAAMQEAGINDKMEKLSDIKMQIAKQQESLNLGLIEEESRIAPMTVVGRRQAKLQQQAAAKIGALASIAQVYQDDVDQAWRVADMTVNALNADRQESIQAYEMMLNMARQDLIRFEADEKEAMEAQIGILQAESARAEQNKNDVMELVLSNPTAAQKAGISLGVDSYQEAVQKMLPYLGVEDLDTQIIDIGGQSALINKRTGEIIRIYGTFDDVSTPDWVYSAANLITDGKAKLTDYDTEQRGLISEVLDQMPPKEEDITKIQDKVSELDAILSHSGLDESVGPTKLSRIDWWAFSGAKQDFISKVQRLLSSETLQSLINAKAEGATLGALSDSELKILQQAASTIGTWAIKNDKGEVVGYKIDENRFKEEIGRIKTSYERLIQNNTSSGTANSSFEKSVDDFYIENPQYRETIDKIETGVNSKTGQPYTIEEKRALFESIGIRFSQPLSMGVNRSDVSGIRDFSNVVTSVGRGVATGIEAGSKLWEYGFDFVLEGGKGAPVRVPFSGKVVSAGTSGGFGNSVVVELADGTRIRASHLNDIKVKNGQIVDSSTVLGGQGNSGKTYGKTGIHVDYTMYKPDGTPYTSQEVASFFNTRALT